MAPQDREDSLAIMKANLDLLGKGGFAYEIYKAIKGGVVPVVGVGAVAAAIRFVLTS